MEQISGFSKMDKSSRINWIANQVSLNENSKLAEELGKFLVVDGNLQNRLDEFSENTLTNFPIPYGIAPNFLINNQNYSIPMVIEESSVVAAAARSAKFWATRGGFQARILGTLKKGQVHFLWAGEESYLREFFDQHIAIWLQDLSPLYANMKKRGGGIRSAELISKCHELADYYQIDLSFETCDAMGANFINTILENIAKLFSDQFKLVNHLQGKKDKFEIIMSILSNYTPECLVEAQVQCREEDLGEVDGLLAAEFADRFEAAINISKIDISRAVTHNKGIMNGIDAVVIATGNDFRAIEACAHAYATRSGQYRGLSECHREKGFFTFKLQIPMAIGSVGGLTSLHPLAKISLDILKQPNAQQLMQIVACAGLAQNFAAVRSLVTTGIQKGHMRMHLLNVLNQLGASKEQIDHAKKYFQDKVVSFQSVRDYLGVVH